ncbi:DUF862-domain-containing protein [Mytilinidion resinicola]|uniref:DUF862-domain-containing protein n=1 Tax=Mytilinidion resinicola TaxID=574789 RepID=A0A6A6YMC7_9PEZI|nr:DUF862-domain-containing protein [Mytilinidion resinicola]KAF2809144.1 DUF862-domain-containing protein [Mytilinidion resinicola]
MDVQLYVYDLSQGLARQLSRQFLGTQIDAVYHTALVFGGVEYFFGQGIQTCYPGTTHHGAPMEIIPMGETALPMEIILEYMDSLKEIYTPESYDLFLHNCNNFSNDFAMFLVGRGIPDHITSLPQTVLNTPFGQMLKPQLDSAMRSVTQAPVPQQNVPPQPALSRHTPNGVSHKASNGAAGKVHNVTSLQEVERLLGSAIESCAIIFFTSSTCAPCKIVYPTYDEIAAEAGSKGVIIKVDINNAYDVSAKYGVRATPTFMTFLRGQKQDEWSGADSRRLWDTAKMLLDQAFPPHPHLLQNVPTLLHTSLRPITYPKAPPLDKLTAKMGPAGHDPAVTSIVSFIKSLSAAGAIDSPLPSLPAFAAFLRSAPTTLPPELLFTALDLLRTTLPDPRVAGWFAEEHTASSTTGSTTTITHLLAHVTALGPAAPYNLRLTTLHLACNLFASPLFIPHLLAAPLSSLLVNLLTTALLDEAHAALRASAVALAMNLAGANHKVRKAALSSGASAAAEEELGKGELPESEQVELLASLLEMLGRGAAVEENDEVRWRGVVCVGWIVFGAPREGEVRDLCEVLGARGTVGGVKVGSGRREAGELVKEVEGLVGLW